MADAGDVTESGEQWGKCMYQFDEDYARDTAVQYRPWITEDIIPRISSLIKTLDEYKILAIGSGTGSGDKMLLELISEHLKSQNIKGPKFVYTVVEPDTDAVEVCKKNLASVDGLDIEFKWEPVTMEEYFKRKQCQFEMVHFIHSLCEVSVCVKIFPEILRKNYVREDGILFTVLGDHENNFFLKLFFANMEKLWKGQGEHPHSQGFQDPNDSHEHEHDHQPHQHEIVGSSDIDNLEKVIKKEKWNFKMFSQTSKEDVIFIIFAYFILASDIDNLEKVIKKEKWNFKMFSQTSKEDVTEILTKSQKGITKLSLMMETKEIDKVLSEEEFNDIMKQIDDAAERKIVDGQEARVVESLNHIIIVYHD